MISAEQHKVKSISVSEQMRNRFEKNKLRRNIASILINLTNIIYLSWRLTILSEDSMALSIIYFIAEFFAFILGLTIITTSFNYNHRTPPPPLEGKTVDVLLPVYLEPIDMIRRTIIAARDIEYPHGTIVLDDGKRNEIKQLAEELGVKYYSRTENLHAKAGNINYGLQYSDAEFVMFFDADFMALPHAIHSTIGFFKDEKVSMVQAPQEYYNTDGFQYINSGKGRFWHDQYYFYGISQACRDTDNATTCVGTNTLFRRSAIDAIGGIPTATVTEDMHTSIKMQKLKYQIVYLNEPIAYGEAAPDLKEYYKTRHRWGSGNLHVLREENVLFAKDLTFKQKWASICIGLLYLEGWQQFFVFIVPVITLLFGLQPFEITIFNILIVLLFPLLSYVFLQESGCGFSRFWPNEIYAMTRWPVNIISCAGLFKRKIAWKTSTKSIKARVHWDLMLPQLTVMFVSLGALIFAIFKVGLDYKAGPLHQFLIAIVTEFKIPENISIHQTFSDGYTIDLVMIAGFWASYNILKVICFVIKVLKNARDSSAFFRFEVPFPIEMENNIYGRTNKISETWLSADIYDANIKLKIGDELIFKLFLNSGSMDVKIKIESLKNNKTSKHIEGRFVWEGSSEKRDVVSKSLYSVDWHREFLSRQAYFLTPIDIISRLSPFRKKDLNEIDNENWNPVLLNHQNSEDNQLYGILAKYKNSNSYASLITFSNFLPSASLTGLELLNNSTKDLSIEIDSQKPIAALSNKGLDGSLVSHYKVKIL